MTKSCCETDESGVVGRKIAIPEIGRLAARHDIPCLAPINNFMIWSISETLFDYEFLR
jgi:hypothetical protein